ncbi:ABC transporter substrate-binding protein [Deinococcus fonticola]|uniref:ABC transporter substrate-binding protein n=1 Tax=Deinococcus fonticola TaxID=2528713 RepID=UPI0010756146|nr:ABC transporter substrate-binding protein [Deinococcus fonticola]
MRKSQALTAALVLSTFAAAQKTALIGWSGAITGPTSDAGASYAAGIEDYCKYANAQKLVPGVTLKCEVDDDKYLNDVTQKNFRAFVAQKASVFLGYSTGGTLQIKDEVQKAKLPTIAGSYHIGNIDRPSGDYVFLPISSYSEQLVSLVEYVAKRERTAKVALVLNPSPFGRAPVPDVKEAAKRLGVNIVSVEEVGGNNTDNTALLKKLQGLGVKYVIHQNTAGPVANILKDAQKLGITGDMVHMGAHYTGGGDLVTLAGDAATNFIWATSFYLYDEADRPGIQLMRQIGRDMKRSTDTVKSVNYTAGMLAASIAVEAMKRGKGDTSPAAVYKALTSMVGSKTFDPGFSVGPVSFSVKDHIGTENLRLLMLTPTGKFMALTAPQRSQMFKLIRPN